MIKGIIIGVALTLLVGLGVGFALVHSGSIPANADAQPGSIETWMAKTSLDSTLRKQAPNEQNPVALTDQNLSDGVDLFAQNCSVCHGSAKGDDAASPIAKGLYQKPPQFATEGVEDDPEGYSYWKMKHGIRLTGMPSFSQTLSDRQIWTIALFLKHMDKLPPAVQAKWEHVQNWPMKNATANNAPATKTPE